MKTRKIFEIIIPENCRPVSAFLRTLDNKKKKKISVQLENLQYKDCPLKPPMVKTFQQERETTPALETARARKLALATGDAGATEILQGGIL